jgi:hypothetical protein
MCAATLFVCFSDTEDATPVGAMVTYFCRESVPPMMARQGWVAAALLRERECFQHPVPPSTVPAKLHTALTPAKSKKYQRKILEHISAQI